MRRRGSRLRTERTLLSLTPQEMALAQRAAEAEERELAVLARMALLQRARAIVGDEEVFEKERPAVPESAQALAG